MLAHMEKAMARWPSKHDPDLGGKLSCLCSRVLEDTLTTSSSSPLKIGPNCPKGKGKDRLPSIFRGYC